MSDEVVMGGRIQGIKQQLLPFGDVFSPICDDSLILCDANVDQLRHIRLILTVSWQCQSYIGV